MVVTTGARGLRTMMTCRPLVRVVRHTSSSCAPAAPYANNASKMTTGRERHFIVGFSDNHKLKLFKRERKVNASGRARHSPIRANGTVIRPERLLSFEKFVFIRSRPQLKFDREAGLEKIVRAGHGRNRTTLGTLPGPLRERATQLPVTFE